MPGGGGKHTNLVVLQGSPLAYAIQYDFFKLQFGNLAAIKAEFGEQVIRTQDNIGILHQAIFFS
jgi:hypothetical protein